MPEGRGLRAALSMSLHTTSSQTVGPFFLIGLGPGFIPVVAGPDIPGEHVVISGRVLDGDGQPVSDALIETWQADANGVYSDPEDSRANTVAEGFIGFGRIPTDTEGHFMLTTIKPGRVPGPGATLQAPHLVILVFMRGLLRQLVTRLYFPDEPSNAEDPILALVPEARRATLIAQHATTEDGALRWDIHLQGEDETVFFDM
jgi:protocatechuate 3,4-dioxygenase alpha subunit